MFSSRHLSLKGLPRACSSSSSISRTSDFSAVARLVISTSQVKVLREHCRFDLQARGQYILLSATSVLAKCKSCFYTTPGFRPDLRPDTLPKLPLTDFQTNAKSPVQDLQHVARTASNDAMRGRGFFPRCYFASETHNRDNKIGFRKSRRQQMQVMM